MQANSTLLARTDRWVNAENTALIAQWLGGLFIGPMDSDAVEKLLGAQRDGLLDEIGSQLGCEAAVVQMQQALPSGTAAEIEAVLACRYTGLFEGVAGRHSIPLYQSMYFGTANRLFSQPFEEMRELLRHLDRSILASCSEPADHVSIELAALAAAIESDKQPLITELQNRLATWVPELTQRIQERDEGGFYSGAASVLVALAQAQIENQSLMCCDSITQ